MNTTWTESRIFLNLAYILISKNNKTKNNWMNSELYQNNQEILHFEVYSKAFT